MRYSRKAVDCIEAGDEIAHPARGPVYFLRQLTYLLPAGNIFRPA